MILSMIGMLVIKSWCSKLMNLSVRGI